MKRKVKIKRITRGRTAGQWRFTLVGDNGEPVATSGSETYKNLGDMLQTITKYFPDFKIVNESGEPIAGIKG